MYLGVSLKVLLHIDVNGGSLFAVIYNKIDL